MADKLCLLWIFFGFASILLLLAWFGGLFPTYVHIGPFIGFYLTKDKCMQYFANKGVI